MVMLFFDHVVKSLEMEHLIIISTWRVSFMEMNVIYFRSLEVFNA